jgi:amino acid transporter
MPSTLKRILIGRPLSNAEAEHQRISKTVGLAVFSSDAISSTAYATQEVMLVLIIAGGMAATKYLLPLAILVGVLLVIVINSYRQTIAAYPHGGGAYQVSRDNLGTMPSLVAGASLLTDYILTVAVSVSAGVAAIISAFPGASRYRVLLCLVFIGLLMVGNLRGLKESGAIFAAPTYLYIVMLGILLVMGYVQLWRGSLPELAHHTASLKELGAPLGGTGAVGVLILFKAFASGAVALTGVEAISDGAGVFREPTSKNASRTLMMMGAILGTAFLGLTILAHHVAATPSENGETILSILGRTIYGGKGVPYYVLQIATMTILVLAANTAYADFPRLANFVASDGFLPRQFANRGDRLVYSNGILILSGAAALLLVVFGGTTSALIPLYAVGVFTGFTLSQFGMFRRHRRVRQPKWRLSAAMSLLGAITTFTVLLVVLIGKFRDGAWIPAALIPILVLALRGVKHHYDGVGRQLSVDPAPEAPALRVGIVVLVGSVNRSALMALRFARSIRSHDIVAISVAIDDEHADRLRQQWRDFGLSVPLEVLESPYRDLTPVVLDYLDELERRWGHDYIQVIVPEAVVPHWWQGIFHNQSALALKLRLLNRRDTVVTSVPYHLSEDPAEDTRAQRRRSGATLTEAQAAQTGEPYATNVGPATVAASSEPAVSPSPPPRSG